MPLVPAFDIDRAMADVHWLVEELGPRPYGSVAEQRAALGVKDRLEAAGWKPEMVQMHGNFVACRGQGKRLFLAHVDSVPDSPGAVDNAAGVAILLELARISQAADLCLAFPVGEEVGLLGSTQLARFTEKWHPSPSELELAVALDLTGHGELSVTGLGPKWGTAKLSWLYGQTDPHSEYGYQAVSRAMPWRERSDHRPFAEAGLASLHLLGRDGDGIFPQYHQASDRTVDPEALAETAAALEAIALAPPLPNPKTEPGWTDPAVVIGGSVLPGWASWLLVSGGLFSGFKDRNRWKQTLQGLPRGALALLAGGVAMLPFHKMGLFPIHPAEVTAASTMGMPTGWWEGTPWAVIAALAVSMGLRTLLKPKGSAPLLCAIFCLGLALVEPLLALPMALAAILGRLWPPLALVGGLYWLQPSILRELSFHGLLPPSLWGLALLLLLPAAASGREE
jgi:hypothetical protein